MKLRFTIRKMKTHGEDVRGRTESSALTGACDFSFTFLERRGGCPQPPVNEDYVVENKKCDRENRPLSHFRLCFQSSYTRKMILILNLDPVLDSEYLSITNKLPLFYFTEMV